MIKMPISIIQETVNGIALKPKVFSNGVLARQTYLEMAWEYGYKDKKAIKMSPEQLVEAVNDFIAKDHCVIQWWQSEVELN